MSNKNAEGYADPTATTALARVARDEKAAKSRLIVYVASAYRGDAERNVERAKKYSRFVIERGGVPFTPHLLYTRFLDDADPKQRSEGLFCGKVMLGKCDQIWSFGDVSDGMLGELEEARKRGIPIRYFNEKCEEVT
jgi:hypothetical protein